MQNVKKVLVLTAHADDCEFFAGGFVASLAAAGAEVTEVICTDNGRGSFELPTTELVSASRDREAREAAAVMGKKEVVFLGYPDGFLDELPKNELRRIFMEHIRRVKPDIVLSFDLSAPFEPHPDHRHVAAAATEAVAFANLPLYHPEQIKDGLEPHLVPYRYWFAKNDAMVNRVEDVSASIDTKIKALCAHRSQMRAMMTDIKMAISATGKHQQFLPFLDEDNYAPAVDFMIKAWAASVGAKAGFEYGEAFRYEEAGDLFGKAE